MMKNLTLITLLSLVFSVHSFAEDRGNADNFYQEDYAKTPFSNNSQNRVKEEKEQQREEKNVNVQEKVQPTNNTTVERKESKKSIMDMAGGEKIYSLGAIINGLNESHTVEALNQLVETLKEYSLKGGTVYMLGGFGSQVIYGSDAAMVLNLLGGKLIADNILPEKYQVSKSPTWIVELEEGEALLEGSENLKKHINSKGYFIKPTT